MLIAHLVTKHSIWIVGAWCGSSVSERRRTRGDESEGPVSGWTVARVDGSVATDYIVSMAGITEVGRSSNEEAHTKARVKGLHM
jgi:hypothetical protein